MKSAKALPPAKLAWPLLGIHLHDVVDVEQYPVAFNQDVETQVLLHGPGRPPIL
jgi:hypothetical protein